MKSYTFVLSFGYVEHCSLYYMPWKSSKKFASAKEALVDLSLYLKKKFEESHNRHISSCCHQSIKADSSADFCSKCGTRLQHDFDDEEFRDWLFQMSTCDIDTFHGDFIDWEEDPEWESGDLEDAPNQRFVYQAEWVISTAAGYPYGDKTFEDLCQERTKEKKKSFSYY